MLILRSLAFISKMRLENAFGITITALCKERKISQKGLMDTTYLERKTLQRYLYGERVPAMKNLIKIADSLQVTPGTIVNQAVDLWRNQKS